MIQHSFSHVRAAKCFVIYTFVVTTCNFLLPGPPSGVIVAPSRLDLHWGGWWWWVVGGGVYLRGVRYFPQHGAEVVERRQEEVR